MKATNLKLVTFILTFGLLLNSCLSNKKEQQLGENEGVKKELGKTDTTNVASKKATEIYLVDKSEVKKLFLQYLPKISGGRKLNAADKWDGYEITLADINGDNLVDAVVYYSLEPTMDDAGGGNAILYLPGLVAYINTGKNLIMADHTDDFYAEGLTKIINGVIFLEGHDYANDDPRCCPSIKTTMKFVLKNNKLRLLK
ncbi:MAG: hypothetical protein NTX08_02515 [Sphingobacteriales bacterium]|nr:hypothetical protein [Sphingobacteriales bacterium]